MKVAPTTSTQWKTKLKVNPTDKGSKYEVRLALLFMVRAMLNDWTFSLSCNLPEADKLDDVVFHNETNGIYRFVQSKCKNRGFGQEDLLSPTGDFSLSKYFLSFFSIRSVDQFRHSKLELSLFTTCKLNHISKELVQQVTLSDEIFHFPQHDTRCFRFTNRMAATLFPIVHKSAMTKLAEEMANHMLDGRILSASTDHVKPFIEILLAEVVDFGPCSTALFQREFLRGEHLSARATLFRHWFIVCLATKQLNISQLNDLITNNKLLLVIPSKQWDVEEAQETSSASEEFGLLAREVVDNLEMRRTFCFKEGVLRKYHRFLVSQVFTRLLKSRSSDEDKKKPVAKRSYKQMHRKLFRYDFINGSACLSSETLAFRDIFQRTLTTKAKSVKFPCGFDFRRLNEHLDGPLCLYFRSPDADESVPCSIRMKDIEDFLQSFVLASDQPDGQDLEQYLLKDVQMLAPLSDRQPESIYRDLVFRMSKFHEVVGQWLHSDEAMQWCSMAADQPAPLINPLAAQSPEEIRFVDLNERAQLFLLDREIRFQGKFIKLSELIHLSDAREIITCKGIEMLKTRSSILKIASPIEELDAFESHQYIARTLRIPQVMVETSQEDICYITGYQLHDECEFLDSVQGVAILTAAAGMGKTTLCKYLQMILKQGNPTRWVQRIALSDAKVVNLLKYCEDATEFLENVLLTQHNHLEWGIFHQLLERAEFFILVDDFGNISQEHQRKVLDMINELTDKANVKIVVCTRPQWTEELEFEFGKLSAELCPFTPEDQGQFLAKFWNYQGDKDLGECQALAQELLQVVIAELQCNEIEFVGNPLFCRVLAELFQDPLTLPNKIDITQLFHHFWRLKVDVAFFDKLQQNRNDLATPILCKMFEENARKGLERTALHQVFPDRPELWQHLPEFEWLAICGMMQHDGLLHKTFAEYFIALYITDLLDRGEGLPSHFESVFSDGCYQRIRHFLSFLRKGHARLHFVD